MAAMVFSRVCRSPGPVIWRSSPLSVASAISHKGLGKLHQAQRKLQHPFLFVLYLGRDVVLSEYVPGNDVAAGEMPFCGAGVSVHDLISVDYYLEQRKDGLQVGTVCEGCRALVAPFAVKRSRDLKAVGRVDEAEEYRRLADRLARETASEHWPGKEQADSFMYAPFFVSLLSREAITSSPTASLVYPLTLPFSDLDLRLRPIRLFRGH